MIREAQKRKNKKVVEAPVSSKTPFALRYPPEDIHKEPKVTDNPLGAFMISEETNPIISFLRSYSRPTYSKDSEPSSDGSSEEFSKVDYEDESTYSPFFDSDESYLPIKMMETGPEADELEDGFEMSDLDHLGNTKRRPNKNMGIVFSLDDIPYSKWPNRLRSSQRGLQTNPFILIIIMISLLILPLVLLKYQETGGFHYLRQIKSVFYLKILQQLSRLFINFLLAILKILKSLEEGNFSTESVVLSNRKYQDKHFQHMVKLF